MPLPQPWLNRTRICGRGTLVRLSLILLAIEPALARAEAPAADGGEPEPSAWSGNLLLLQEYRFRTTGSAQASEASALGSTPAESPRSDHDLRLTLDGTVTGLRERMVASVSAALWLDLDGHVPKGEPDFFGDSQDLAQPLFVIYALSAEWRRSAPVDRLAVGRQAATHGLPVTFDGGSLDLRFLERRLSLFGYGGRTVHFFETLPGLLENWLVGGGAGLRLTSNLHLEADSRYLHETVLASAGDVSKPVATNSYGLALTGRSETLSGRLFARGMNRSFSHVGGMFRLQIPTATLGLDGQAAAQLVTLGEIAESENPYYSLLGKSLPHIRARLETWKEFSLGQAGSLTLAAGARVRQLLHDEPTRFNRATNAVYLRADLGDLPWKGAFASLTADWNLPSGPPDRSYFFSLGGAAGYASRGARIETGTYFQRFKINYYREVEELTDARTVYAVASYRVIPQIEIRARYVLEIVDRAIHTTYLTVREDL
jgi:hypothetical protein